MVEKIIINPNEVRGYGNILSPHSSSDYELEDCTIEAGTDTVNGATETVYTLTPTASHSYSLAFSSSSYTASGGSAEVSVTLTDNSVAVSGATVTFTGGTSTVTGTTNSSGVATATITVTETSTITATYSNVSDTCTVTVGPSYLFYDECNSSSGLSNYTFQEIESGTCTGTIAYDSTMNAYKMTSTSGGVKMWCINDLNGLTQLKLTMELYLPSSNVNDSAVSLEVATNTQCSVGYYHEKTKLSLSRHRFQNASWRGNDVIASAGGNKGAWLKYECVIDGTDTTITIYNSGGTQLATANYVLTNTSSDFSTSSYRRYGPGVGWANNAVAYVRNIKAEYI